MPDKFHTLVVVSSRYRDIWKLTIPFQSNSVPPSFDRNQQFSLSLADDVIEVQGGAKVRQPPSPLLTNVIF